MIVHRVALHGAIEVLAAEVLRRHAALVPVDVDAIALSEGLRFEYLDLASVAGAYARDLDPAGWSVAFIKADDPRPIQRFSKAHELAHHLIDERADGWIHELSLPLPSGYTGVDFHEAHEYFAASLLMPRSWVMAEIAEGAACRREIVAAVGSRCDVSRIAAAIRVEELSALPRHAPSAMYARLEPAESRALARNVPRGT